MKRWGFLLALPWSVYASTSTHENGANVTFIWAKHTPADGQEPTGVECGQNFSSCQDFVDAMNTAHSRQGYVPEKVTPVPKKKEPKQKLKTLELKKGG